MVDSIQILLAVVISVLTVLVTVISLAVYQILKELKQSIVKMNFILDDAHRMSSAVAQPVEDASEFIHGVKKGVNFIKSISKFVKDDFLEEEKESKEGKIDPADSGKKLKFFQKNGKSLKKTS